MQKKSPHLPYLADHRQVDRFNCLKAAAITIILLAILATDTVRCDEMAANG